MNRASTTTAVRPDTGRVRLAHHGNRTATQMLRGSTGSRERNIPIILLLLTLVVAPATAAATSPTSIAAARRLPLGTTVTLNGTVSVPSGAFSSSLSDQGFAVQDLSGGIYVSVATDLQLPLSARVRVTGRLAERFGQRILLPASLEEVIYLGQGSRVRPAPIPTGALSQANEGQLVLVGGRVTQPVGADLPYGYRLFVDDGSGEAHVYVNVSTGIDLSGLQPGQHVFVIGFRGYYGDHAELNPRMPGDLVVR